MPVLKPIDFSNTPHSPRWLLKDLLPAHELVVLDGSTGVGKTLTLAVLSDQISKLNGQGVVYLSSQDQQKSRNVFLSRQQGQSKNIKCHRLYPFRPR
jgi:ABC-type proline/glycine betaine transport system ATPase subunit